MEFRWNAWNVEHIAQHGVRLEEAEWVVSHYRATDAGDDKYQVRGQTASGRFLQVVFIIDPEETIFVIHARPLTPREKRRIRRRRRRG